MNKKILIIGPARHGKDSLAEIWRDNFGCSFISSSQAASDIFIYKALKLKYGYLTPEQCFEDRINHRAEWYDLIVGYNKDNKTKLAEKILEKSDCYVGMRDREEIEKSRKDGLFNIIVWVDASERMPGESKESFNIDKSCADVIIENNNSLRKFTNKAIILGNILFPVKYSIEEMKSISFESAVDYKPFNEGLTFNDYYQYGFLKGFERRQELL